MVRIGPYVLHFAVLGQTAATFNASYHVPAVNGKQAMGDVQSCNGDDFFDESLENLAESNANEFSLIGSLMFEPIQKSTKNTETSSIISFKPLWTHRVKIGLVSSILSARYPTVAKS